jgi:5-methyltetrahydrofolate--homocysteine methyltransferase
MDLKALIAHKSPLIMDGAMGTEIFKRVPSFSGCIELLNLEKPDVVLAIHQSYIDAGADIIQTNTFGATPLKLGDYGLEAESAKINLQAAGIARESVRGRNVIVAGTMGPTGRLIEPVGALACEQAYEAFFSQAKSLAAGGVDILTIETMTDVKEARLALIAAKDATGLPVICSMSFEQNGKTVSGTGMLTAFATLAQCGADVVGANCGMGPEGLLRLYRDNWNDLLAVGAPFSVWSNAGMPEIVNGEVVYRLGPQEFAHTSAQMASLGLSVVGGCCGTSPAHIAALRSMIEGAPATRQFDQRYRFITSRVAALDLQGRDTILLVGERLNPTARKKFAEDLKQGKSAFLRDESRAQEAEGAHLLDINVGVPGIDEVAAMKSSLLILDGSVKLPLMIDSDNRDVLEAALMNCPGVPVINSINGKKKSLESVLPLVKRFGAFIVALCMDETGIHRSAEKRIGIGERMLALLEAEGIVRERIFIDPLILAESAEPGSAPETLKVIRHFASSGVKTSIGLSNISFGLPQRKFVNNAFLNMAIAEGLSAASVNPLRRGSGRCSGRGALRR